MTCGHCKGDDYRYDGDLTFVCVFCLGGGSCDCGECPEAPAEVTA